MHKISFNQKIGWVFCAICLFFIMGNSTLFGEEDIEKLQKKTFILKKSLEKLKQENEGIKKEIETLKEVVCELSEVVNLLKNSIGDCAEKLSIEKMKELRVKVDRCSSSDFQGIRDGMKVFKEIDTCVEIEGKEYHYTLVDENTLACMEGITKLWEYVAPGITSPAFDHDGYAYIGDKKGVIHCLDRKRGKLVWQKMVGSSIEANPEVDENGDVFFLTKDGNLYRKRNMGWLEDRLF